MSLNTGCGCLVTILQLFSWSNDPVSESNVPPVRLDDNSNASTAEFINEQLERLAVCIVLTILLPIHLEHTARCKARTAGCVSHIMRFSNLFKDKFQLQTLFLPIHQTQCRLRCSRSPSTAKSTPATQEPLKAGIARRCQSSSTCAMSHGSSTHWQP